MTQNPRFAADCAAFMQEALHWVAEKPRVRSVVLAGLWVGPIVNP
jgi:hypothetical protein